MFDTGALLTPYFHRVFLLKLWINLHFASAYSQSILSGNCTLKW